MTEGTKSDRPRPHRPGQFREVSGGFRRNRRRGFRRMEFFGIFKNTA
jgi:hypothetical protein